MGVFKLQYAPSACEYALVYSTYLVFGAEEDVCGNGAIQAPEECDDGNAGKPLLLRLQWSGS